MNVDQSSFKNAICVCSYHQGNLIEGRSFLFQVVLAFIFSYILINICYMNINISLSNTGISRVNIKSQNAVFLQTSWIMPITDLPSMTEVL